MSCKRDLAPTRLRTDKSKLKSGAKVNVNAVVVGDSELARGNGGLGTKEIDNEAAKLVKETDKETGRTAIEGRG